jgi:hypothetical protein
LSQTALRVSDVGVARTLVRFQPIVIIWFGAILKKDVAVSGGWVIVAPPGERLRDGRCVGGGG